MMRGKARQKISSQMKGKVALEALKGTKTANELAQEYGVHPTQVGQWKKELAEQASSLFEGKRGPKPVDAKSDPERLYTEIGRLKVELDWLKKKSGVDL
jgi:transposase